MPRPAADSVKVTWAGTGTGTMSLGAAVAGFQAFPASFDNQLISYAIENADGSQRENGFGTYSSSGNSLTRDHITFSTAGAPTKQNFTSGTKQVRVTALAHDVIENRATINPGSGDDIVDGYIAGRARWLNTVTDTLFMCVDHTAGNAIWVQLGGSGGIHAATHVSSGGDEIRAATATLNGLATPAQVASLAVVSSTVRTSTFTATAGAFEETDTSGGAFACALTASPTRGMRNTFIDKTDSWGVNALTIDRNGSTIEGLVEDIVASGGKLVQLYYDGTTWRFQFSGSESPGTARLEVLIIAASDETSGLTTGTSVVKFRMPFPMNVSAVRASVGTAPDGAAIIVDINEVVGGVPTSILGTKLSIDDGEKTSQSAASPATIADPTLADDAEMTVDIDQVGALFGGAGLKIQLHGLRF